MKSITSIAAVITITALSSPAFASNGEYDHKDDILHGNGAVSASPYTPYVRTDSGPNGTEGDLLSNLHEVDGASRSIPYVRTDDDRDNRDDMVSNVQRTDRSDDFVASK